MKSEKYLEKLYELEDKLTELESLVNSFKESFKDETTKDELAKIIAKEIYDCIWEVNIKFSNLLDEIAERKIVFGLKGRKNKKQK